MLLYNIVFLGVLFETIECLTDSNSTNIQINYSGTLLIWPTSGHTNLAALMGQGQVLWLVSFRSCNYRYNEI